MPHKLDKYGKRDQMCTIDLYNSYSFVYFFFFHFISTTYPLEYVFQLNFISNFQRFPIVWAYFILKTENICSIDVFVVCIRRKNELHYCKIDNNMIITITIMINNNSNKYRYTLQIFANDFKCDLFFVLFYIQRLCRALQGFAVLKEITKW